MLGEWRQRGRLLSPALSRCVLHEQSAQALACKYKAHPVEACRTRGPSLRAPRHCDCLTATSIPTSRDRAGLPPAGPGGARSIALAVYSDSMHVPGDVCGPNLLLHPTCRSVRQAITPAALHRAVRRLSEPGYRIYTMLLVRLHTRRASTPTTRRQRYSALLIASSSRFCRSAIALVNTLRLWQRMFLL